MPRPFALKIHHLRAVVGIIKRDNRLLVCQRPAHKTYSGYWEFPGGKIEANESEREALDRELHEELGIQVLQSAPWFQHVHDYPDKTVQLFMWHVSAFSGEPAACENQVICWATIDEILQLRLLEGNWAIMEKLSLPLGILS